jgi:hypothetical protein
LIGRGNPVAADCLPDQNSVSFQSFRLVRCRRETGGQLNVFRTLIFEDEMNKLIIAVIATAFASTAFAQAAMETPKDKAKQAEVSATTKAAVDSAGTTKDAEAATKLKAQKGTPKALTTKQEKQAAAAATTAAGSQGADTAKDAATANKLKAQKGTPKALPTKSDKQKAVSGTTEQAVKKDGSN